MMGHTLLSLSSRLSEDYATQLLEKSQADVIIHDRPFVQPTKYLRSIPLAGQEQLESVHIRPEMEIVCEPSVIEGNDVLFIHHSSGSTSLPKLLPVSNDIWVIKMRQFRKILHSTKRDWPASAMYNYFGFSMLCHTLTNKSACTFFENDRTHFSPQGALAFLDEAQPQELQLTPWTLSVLASTQGGIERMKQADDVRTFGAVCPDELGNMLVRKGVRLSNNYGTTEIGGFMTSHIRPADDDEWDWLVPRPGKKAFVDMRPLTKENSLHELVVLPGHPELLPAVQAADGSYATGDLFLKHPTKPDRWKIVGRKDDQLKIYKDDRLILVNAIMYEQKVMEGIEDVVDDVVVFGQGRGKLGVLVFAQGAEPGSKTAQSIEDRMWEAVQQQINGKLPVGIDRDMILVVDTRRAALPQTGKFNLIRAQVYMAFKELIDQAFERSDQSAARNQVPVHANGHL